MDLSHRERILMALEHKESDRVPVDLGGMDCSGIMGIAYNQLKDYWNIKEGETKIYNVLLEVALVEPEILRRINADVMPISLRIGGQRRWKDWLLPDGSPCQVPEDFNPERLTDGSSVLRDEENHIIFKMPPGGYYFDRVYHPLAKASSIIDLKKYNFHKFINDTNKENLNSLEENGKNLYENRDYALMLNNTGSIYESAQALRGWDIFMMDLAAEPRFASYLLDKLTEALIYRLEQILPKIGKYLQIIEVGDDLGMQDGPQISPELYRKLIKPRHKKFYRYIKEHSDAYLFLHTCGAIYDFIPDFIEMGVDILNPVQISAKDMDSKRLKREFGKDIVFWGGGCDTQKVLPFGTPEEVKKEVKRRIEDFAPGGGFIFSQVHNIQAGVPPENIEAMFEAVKEYG